MLSVGNRTTSKAVGPSKGPRFSFVDVENATVSTQYTSNSITVVSGGSLSLSLVGGEYSINGGAFATSGTTVNNGDTIRLRLTSSALPETIVTAQLTLGGDTVRGRDTFSVMTARYKLISNGTTGTISQASAATAAEIRMMEDLDEIRITEDDGSLRILEG